MGTDYKSYRFTWRDWIEYILRITVKGAVIGYLFYDSLKMCIICIPFFIVDYRELKKEKLKKQKRELTLQFKAMMEALVTSLTAGYSLEHAFTDAKRDLSFIYENYCINYLWNNSHFNSSQKSLDTVYRSGGMYHSNQSNSS